MRLIKIFSRLNIDENYDFDIKKIETNTKNCDNHTLFVAIKGTRVDTHEEKYLMEAYNNGARAFIVEREVNLPKDAVVFVVENSRKTLGLVSSTFFGHPSKTLRVIGVTGTKGKTSVAFIIKEIIEKYGFKCGIVGTSGIFYGNKHIKTNNTTPDPFTLQKAMREAVDAGIQYMVIEVSSQAMKQSRVFGTRFMANIFTNLSPDHIGPLEHENFEEYRKWKKNILLLAKKTILNKDDENYEFMIDGLKNPHVSVGRSEADFVITNESEDGFDLNGKHIATNLHGSYNRMNLALALATLNEIGFSFDKLAGLAGDLKIPGRMEVLNYNGRKVVIDYAHNKLSIESLLAEIKSWEPKRILIAVGSVGGRTYERRHEIPEAANKYADEIYITSDNPDFEDPEKILGEMAKHSTIKTHTIADRKTAVESMLADSKPGDIIVLAGKGDEDFQLIEGKKVPYSDKKTVENFIKRHK